MGVTLHPYVVDGWGAGELWSDGDTVVQHVLPSPVGDGSPGVSLGRGGHWPGPGAPRPGPGAAGPGPGAPNGGTSAPDGIVGDEARPDRTGFAPPLCSRFARHLGGEPMRYDDVTIDFEWATPFQAELIAALRAVPWGEVVSYSELAALAGRPRAARAAGSLCAANPFALIVPCHRVVASGGIGGYGPAGVALKRRLLALEGVSM